MSERRLTDIEIARLKREGRDRLMGAVKGMLKTDPPAARTDAPAARTDTPAVPKKRFHPLWFLAAFGVACMVLLAIAVIPGAFL